MKFVIVRDIGMLLMVAQLWYASRTWSAAGSAAVPPAARRQAATVAT